MRVLLLSDTHGKVHERIAALSTTCDYVVHAGDVGAAAVISALRPRVAVVAVRGNNDTPGQWPETDLDNLCKLPTGARLALPGGVLAVVHGHRTGPAAGRHVRLRARNADCRVVVYGHTHRLVLDTTETPWVINPGAAGRARTFGGPSCVLLEATKKTWTVEARRFPPLP